MYGRNGTVGHKPHKRGNNRLVRFFGWGFLNRGQGIMLWILHARPGGAAWWRILYLDLISS
jgi:hypothetical protein